MPCSQCRITCIIFAFALIAISGCQQQTIQRVVLYCSQDREYAEYILADFTSKTGIVIEYKGDTESNKSVGLFEAIVRESSKPRCDVFWCNEPVLMQRLAQRQMLEAYESPAAVSYPDWTRPANKSWQAFASRARVLIVHQRIPEVEVPKSLSDLAVPKWSKRWAMAKPFFGTTATHAACLWHRLGVKTAQELLTNLSRTAVLLPGNRDVAEAVAQGYVDLGLTDSDDAIVVIEKKYPVRIHYLDQPEPGTLFLPNTLGLIKGAPHLEAGKKLIDYLLSEEVEIKLAQGPSAQIPLNPKVKLTSLRIKTPSEISAMTINYDAVANQWEDVQVFLRNVFRD